MKLFNLNICNKKDNNQQIVDLVNTCACDIVTIQESMRALDKDVDPFYDSYNVLKNQTNYQNDFFGAVWVAKTRKNNGVITKDFGGYIEQGNQILTNLPIIQAKNVFFYQEYSTFEDETNFRQNDHPRAFVDAILKVGDKSLQIINIHGNWSADKNGNKRTKNQTKILLKKIRTDIPCIVVGDFNLLPQTKEIKLLSKKMRNLVFEYDIKSTRPDFDDGLDTGNIICDYVFVNDKVKVNNFSVPQNTASDHYPMILDFEIWKKIYI